MEMEGHYRLPEEIKAFLAHKSEFTQKFLCNEYKDNLERKVST